MGALLKASKIAESNSPYAASLLFAQKKDGSLRMCCDLCALNKITVKDAFLAPHSQDLFDAICGAKYFTTLDLRSGSFQIRINPAHTNKTAFRTLEGLYEWLVMPFGAVKNVLTRLRANQLKMFSLVYVPINFTANYLNVILFVGRPRGTVGKASASEAGGPRFEPPWLVQRSRR